MKSGKNIFEKFLIMILSCSLLILFTLMPAFASVSKQNYISQLKKQGFPESYCEKLWNVHCEHPNWQFRPMDTGLDWDSAVKAESSGRRNLVYIQPNSSYCATRLYRDMSSGYYTNGSPFGYHYPVRDGNDSYQCGWIDATPMAVAFYMNPCSFIGNSSTILQFELLQWEFGNNSKGYKEAVSTVEGIVKNTFMSSSYNRYNRNFIDGNGNIKYRDSRGSWHYTGKTYAETICEISKKYNVSPGYLASKIIGEVGVYGSGSVTGTYGSYPGYYNYLNIGAYDSSNGNAVNNGLKTAKNRGWNTPAKAIEGGASEIYKRYIGEGQNTPYLQKFNVTRKNTYNHQYMTAVNGVVNTTWSTYKGYENNGMLDIKRTFSIPVFKNMPSGNGTSVRFKGYSNSEYAKGKTVCAVNVRSGPGVYHNWIGRLETGSEVTLLGGYRDSRIGYTESRMYTPLWYKVKMKNGKIGYMCEDYLENSNSYAVKKGTTKKLRWETAGDEIPYFMVQDTRIATVDSDGTVKGKNYGNTKVVVYLSGGAFDVLNLKVDDKGTIDPEPEPEVKPEPKPEKTKPDTVEELEIKGDRSGYYKTYFGDKEYKITGLVPNKWGWWYFDNGILDFTYSGIEPFEGGLWKVTNGKLDREYTGLAMGKEGWYYFNKGKYDDSAHGIYENAYGKWYVNKGKIDFTFSGKYEDDKGSIYSVKNGKVVNEK